MDLESVLPDALGRSMQGIGLNLLCRDVRTMTSFMQAAFELQVHRESADFAIVTHRGMMLQLHSDATFGAHPLHGLLPEAPPRGCGAQIYLFGIDPDIACAKAEAAGGLVVEQPTDKPHGLREATILAPEGYAFSPAIARVAR